MSRAVHTEVPKVRKGVNRRLVFGIGAAPLAWLVHEVTGFAIVGRNCPSNVGLVTWQWVALGAITVVSLGLAVTGALVSLRVFRSWRRDARLTRSEGWDRIEFLALFGVFTSLLLLLNLVFFSVLPLVLEPCLSIS